MLEQSHKLVKIFLATLFLFFSSSQTFAHCAMCKTAIEQANSGNALHHLALAALFLFIPALTLFVSMLVILYKHKN